MPATKFDKESIKNTIIGKVQRYNGPPIEEASKAQIYRALASTVRDQIMQKALTSREERKRQKGKRLYYLSVEFLMGRAMYCNMLNMLSTRPVFSFVTSSVCSAEQFLNMPYIVFTLLV